MGQAYRHKNTSVSVVNYHFVWIPRRRKKVLIGQVAERLKELLYEICKELDIVIVALEVMPDHVHAFLNCPPTLAPFQIMHRIKGHTARVLREEFKELLTLPSMWTRSYFVSTAGNVSSETVRQYILQQRTRG
jgi:putative transposase